jgi:hypothetical protein
MTLPKKPQITPINADCYSSNAALPRLCATFFQESLQDFVGFGVNPFTKLRASCDASLAPPVGKLASSRITAWLPIES